MSISEQIERLILLNIEMWHEVEKNKNLDGSPKQHNTVPEDRLTVALKVRELNRERSELRWQIDQHFGQGTNETKIDVYSTEEA